MNKLKGERYAKLIDYIRLYLDPKISTFMNFDMISYDGSILYDTDVISVVLVVKNNYKTKSLKFSRSDKVDQLFALLGVSDVEISNSGNLIIFFNYNDIKEHIETNEIQNLYKNVKTLYKFNL